MIQRVQTIFLFLIALSMGLVVSTPIWEKAGSQPGEMARLTALQYSYKQGVTTFVDPVWYIAGLAMLVATVAIFAVFRYRNRLQQMGLCAVNALLMTTMMGVILYQTLFKGKEYGNPDNQGDFLTGFYAIVAALLFNMLANRFIRRDERLVRESDRIR